MLKILSLVLTRFCGKYKNLKNIQGLFEFKAGHSTQPNQGGNRDEFSQNIKTVSTGGRREASKSSLYFLPADKSLSLSSSLRLRNGGHKILVSARKRRGLSLS